MKEKITLGRKESSNPNSRGQLSRRRKVLGVVAMGMAGLVASGNGLANADGVPCDPNIDVCVPGPGSSTVPEFTKPTVVETTTTVTQPETTTTVTQPETTTTVTPPEETTTTVTQPETTTTVTPPEETTTTVTHTSTPPGEPTITVAIPGPTTPGAPEPHPTN